MRVIVLTHGKVALVDDEDYSFLLPFKWYAARSKQLVEKWYAKRVVKSDDGKVQNIYMHRAIMNVVGAFEVDHKDRDGLNNTRDNLRICSRRQNCANAIGRVSISGFRGVYWNPRNQNYRADVQVDGKPVRLGSFKCPEEAARVRDARAYEIYGEFAILNFPRSA